MTDANDTLLTAEPFVRFRAYTLWRREGNLKIPVHADGRTKHSTTNPAPMMSAAEAAAAVQFHHSQGDAAVGFGFRPDGTGLVCLDLDESITPEGQWSPGALAMIARMPGALIEQSTGGRGAHLWTYAPAAAAHVARRGQITTPHGKLEMYANGQFLAGGRVLGGDARTDHSAALMQMLAEFWPAAPARDVGDADWEGRTPEQRAITLAQLRSALAHVPQSNYDEWMRAGSALKSLGDDGFELWHEFSRLRPDQYDEQTATRKWRQLGADRTDYRAIFAKAQAAGWVNPEGREAKTAAVIENFTPPVITGATVQGVIPMAPPAPANVGAKPFQAGDGGLVTPSISSVSQALRARMLDLHVGRDTFRGAQMIGQKGQWRDWEDEDYTVVRETLENAGFKPVPAEIVKSSVASVARENQFDSALQWAATLAWDGVPRVTTAMHAYYGAQDTPYTRAVGEYLFTALADRLLNPGCQADMVVVLVGDQGLAKTSAVAALAPTPSAFVEVSLSHRDETDLSRRLRGKLVAEIAEMRGLGTKEIEGIRAWVTRRTEAWVPKYREAETTYARRFLALGTVNGEEFLDDAEGERRWLPTRVGVMDLKGLERDRDQLWAEGVHMLRNGGQRWQRAQELARLETSQFKVTDPWTPDVIDWLAGKTSPQGFLGRHVPGSDFTTRDVLGGLNIAVERMGRSESVRVGKILKGLGYRLESVRENDGTIPKKWRK